MDLQDRVQRDPGAAWGFPKAAGIALLASAVLWALMIVPAWLFLERPASSQELATIAPTNKTTAIAPHTKAALTPSFAEPLSPPPGYIGFCVRVPSQCAVPSGAPAVMSLSLQQWALLADVNKSVNEAIWPEGDQEHYGRMEYWNIPTDGYGDCEDYALTKRQKFITNGFSELALRIAIVRTRQGKRHAILTVAADDGDYVLDSFRDIILPWNKTDYEWISRQDPDSPSGWVSLTPKSEPVVQDLGTAAVLR